jgi:hypothetical protein
MTSLKGIHVLTLDNESGAVARRWLDASRDDAILPPYYVGDDVLVQHIDRAVRSVSNFLSGRQHTNRVSRDEFCGIVYLADDPSVKPYSIAVQDIHVIVIGIQWVFALVKICDRLSVPLSHRRRSGPPAASSASTDVPPRDVLLSELLSGDLEVSSAEAIRIAETWPSPMYMHTEDELGTWAVFYDLIRLVWFHELAHALCGHIRFAKETLGLTALYESNAEGKRSTAQVPDGSTSEILQCLEMHADEFAVRSSLGEILWGHDPADLMIRLRVDLGDRLLHLNTAFCVFAVLWELDERKRTLPAVAWSERSHPPVDLRYDRFRNYQRELCMRYDTMLLTVVDRLSLAFLQVLTQASPYFGDLARLTPLLVRTPSMDDVERYEQYLMRLEPAIAAQLELYGFIPAEFLESQE